MGSGTDQHHLNVGHISDGRRGFVAIMRVVMWRWTWSDEKTVSSELSCS